jgi:hypothetical protein
VEDDSIRANSDRITKAPSTAVQVSNEDSNEAQPSPLPDESDEYVLERIVEHTDEPNGDRLLRVRWYGYEEDEDTWAQEEGIPRQFIIRYWRSNKNDTC